MTKASLVIVMALATTPAFAQYRDFRAPNDFRSPNGIPVYQLGSGQHAGGPANELISPTGGPVAYHRYVVGRPAIPAYQLGSGQRAGGPANELNNAGSIRYFRY